MEDRKDHGEFERLLNEFYSAINDYFLEAASKPMVSEELNAALQKTRQAVIDYVFGSESV